MNAAVVIFARLKELPAVTQLIGAGDAIRAYPHSAPPDERNYPLICFRCRDDDPGQWYAQGAGDLIHETIDIACIARTLAEARNLYGAVDAGIGGQWGNWGGITVQGCFKEGVDETTVEIPGSDERFFVVEVTYSVWYELPES